MGRPLRSAAGGCRLRPSAVGPVDWIFGRLADHLLGRLARNGGDNDSLADFDPRTLRGWTEGPSTGGHRVYEGQDDNSWFIDVGSDGTIDAHVVQDSMGDFWVDHGDGQGYVNVGPDPNGDGQ